MKYVLLLSDTQENIVTPMYYTTGDVVSVNDKDYVCEKEIRTKDEIVLYMKKISR